MSTGSCSVDERHPGLWEFPMWNIQDSTGVTLASMDPTVSGDAGGGGQGGRCKLPGGTTRVAGSALLGVLGCPCACHLCVRWGLLAGTVAHSARACASPPAQGDPYELYKLQFDERYNG